MARGQRGSKVDPSLKRAVSKLLKETMDAPKATLSDKCKAIDRALKLAAIEAKMDDSGYGSGFGSNDPEGDE